MKPPHSGLNEALNEAAALWIEWSRRTEASDDVQKMWSGIDQQQVERWSSSQWTHQWTIRNNNAAINEQQGNQQSAPMSSKGTISSKKTIRSKGTTEIVETTQWDNRNKSHKMGQ
jgi:hypothetical protein